MTRMAAKEYKKLRVEISKRYTESLELGPLDAYELAGEIYCGEITKKELFRQLDEAVADDSLNY